MFLLPRIFGINTISGFYRSGIANIPKPDPLTVILSVNVESLANTYATQWALGPQTYTGVDFWISDQGPWGDGAGHGTLGGNVFAFSMNHVDYPAISLITGQWLRQAVTIWRTASEVNVRFYPTLPAISNVLALTEDPGYFTAHPSDDSAFVFGYSPWAVSESYNGAISAVKVFQRRLTEGEILRESESAWPVLDYLRPSLWCLLPLGAGGLSNDFTAVGGDGAANDLVLDYSGNGRHFRQVYDPGGPYSGAPLFRYADAPNARWGTPYTQTRRRLAQMLSGVSSGTQTFSYSASGGLTFGGAAARAKLRALAASGGLQFSGAATKARVRVAPTAGGLSLSGAAAFAKGKTVSPAGGLSLSGAGSQIRGASPSPSGGLILSGSAGYSSSGTQQYSYSPSGGIQFGGVIAEARARVVIASGGSLFGGSAGVSTHEAVRTVLPSGGFQFGGAAAYTNITVGGGQSESLIRARRRLVR